MYIPKKFEITDKKVIEDFIRSLRENNEDDIANFMELLCKI